MSNEVKKRIQQSLEEMKEMMKPKDEKRQEIYTIKKELEEIKKKLVPVQIK